MALTENDLHAIQVLLQPINIRLDKMDNRLDKMDSEVSSLKAGQLEIRKYLKNVDKKVSATYDVQGLYAFVIGLLIALVYVRFDDFLAPVLFHGVGNAVIFLGNMIPEARRSAAACYTAETGTPPLPPPRIPPHRETAPSMFLVREVRKGLIAMIAAEQERRRDDPEGGAPAGAPQPVIQQNDDR